MRRRLSALLLLLSAGGFACREDRPILFGVVLPLTGPTAIYGEPIGRGIELAQIHVQQRYPELAPRLQLEIEDSGSDPEKAAELADQLYQAGALAIIGGATSAEAMAMVPVADKHDHILLSPSASSPELTGISTNFLRVFPSDFLEGTKMATFAANILNVDSAVILAEKQPYAKGIQEIFQAEFERHGGKLLEVLEYPPNTADFSGLIERVLALEAEAVYLAAYADDIARMIEALRGQGYRGVILTTSAFATPEVIEEVGEAAEGVYLTQTLFDPQSEEPAVRMFVEAYREKYGSPPDLYSAHGYDAMMVLVEALQKGGRRTPSEFWKGLRGISDYQGVTGPLQFDDRGDVHKFPRVYVIEAGEISDYEGQVERRRRELMERLQNLERRQRNQ